MRVLAVHNYYKLRGGEDVVFESEVRLLLSHGHDVHTVTLSNGDVASVGAKARALLGTVRNPDGIQKVLRAIDRHRPQIAHFHNVFPLFSPAVYQACRNVGVAVVQTLHNFRPICLGSLLLRDGRPCGRCVNSSSLPGVWHRCYRDSFVASAAAARMVSVHRRRGTWQSKIDRYIALTDFGRKQFVEAGFPADRIEVKPNFMADPGAPPSGQARSGVLFVGRLSPEKGVSRLIEACNHLRCELRIAGTGQELEKLRAQAGPTVTFLGVLNRPSVLAEMSRACVVAVPSLWFEGFPMVVVEAFSCGTPVIASRLGALAEIVEDGVTGLLYPPEDPAQLALALALSLANPGMTEDLGKRAREVFTQRYTPTVNLGQLTQIYSDALDQSASN